MLNPYAAGDVAAIEVGRYAMVVGGENKERKVASSRRPTEKLPRSGKYSAAVDEACG